MKEQFLLVLNKLRARRFIVFEVVVILILPFMFPLFYKYEQITTIIFFYLLIIGILEISVALHSLLISQKKLGDQMKNLRQYYTTRKPRKIRRPRINSASTLQDNNQVDEKITSTSFALKQFVDLLEKRYREIGHGKQVYVQLTKIEKAMNTENFDQLFVEAKRTFPTLVRLEKDRNGEPLVRLIDQ